MILLCIYSGRCSSSYAFDAFELYDRITPNDNLSSAASTSPATSAAAQVGTRGLVDGILEHDVEETVVSAQRADDLAIAVEGEFQPLVLLVVSSVRSRVDNKVDEVREVENRFDRPATERKRERKRWKYIIKNDT